MKTNKPSDHFFSWGVRFEKLFSKDQIYFDPAFQRIRKNRSNFKIPEDSKRNLENSIKRGYDTKGSTL